MKFLSMKTGQVGLLLACCVVLSACNKEEFFKAEEFLVGKDAYCFQEGQDLESCHALGNECRAAYLDAEDGSQEPEFAMCISNPNNNPDSEIADTDVADSDGEATDGSVADGSTNDGAATDGSVADGSTNDGAATDGSVADGSTNDGAATDGSVADGSTNDDAANDGSDASNPSCKANSHASVKGKSASCNAASNPVIVPVMPPLSVIEQAVLTSCQSLDPKYLWTKKEVSKNGTKTTSKVKLCHQTSSGKPVTIVVACPALKAHISHADYLGVCLE
jgi:hypothetical protein